MLLDVETQSKLVVLMFTDLAGSVDMKTRLGAHAYAGIISRHDQIFKQILATTPRSQTIKDTGDGFLARFETTSDAVRAALRFQCALHREQWNPEPARVRIGLHIGQVAELEKEDATGLPKIVGLAADIAARVMDLAVPGQILMTRTLFDDGRQNIREHPPTGDDTVPEIKWMAHGPYLFKGSDEPLDVFEVGAVGIAPLKEPPDSGKARRAVRPGDEDLLGWRPAAGLEVPSRGGWVLDKQLGEGGFGEVWLASQQRTKEQRVLKFCYDPDRLRSFKREMTLFRLLREALGARDDIVRLYEVRLDQPPFFLESAYSPEGDLTDWADRQGGIGHVPLATRLHLVAGIADALAAAHSVGVLHKDIKPANILIRLDKGQPQPILADFGIGMIGDMSQLANRNITMTGFTETVIDGNDSSRTGTRLYSPPELLTGKPFTVQGDIFSLGVVLYQMVIGDLSRPLAHGWESQIQDPLLRADIAACVAGDPDTRLKGSAELAQRLRSLDARRAQQEREAHAAAAIRRRRMLVRTAVTASILLAIGAAFLLFMLARESSLRQDAEKASEEANTQRLAAEAATAQAVTARNLADKERRRAEFQAYAANLAASDTALRFNDPVEARRQLELAPQEIRAWEWHHLMGRIDQSLHTIDLQGDVSMVSRVAWSPDGSRLACGSFSGSVLVFDADTLKELVRFKAHPSVLNSLAYSPDGKWLITSGRDKSVRIWNAQSCQTGGELTFDNACQVVAYSADHSLLAVQVGFDKLLIVRTADQQVLHELSGIYGNSTAIFTLDNAHLIYSSGTTFHVLELTTFKNVAEFDNNHGASVISIHFIDGDDRHVLSADRNGFIHSWERKTGKSRIAYRFPRAGSDMVKLQATRKEGVVAVFEDGSIQAMIDGDEEKVITLHGHTDRINDLAMHPTRDDLFATCSFDGTLKIWSTRAQDHGTVLDTYGSDAIVTARDSPLIAILGSYSLDLWNLDHETRIVHTNDVHLDELGKTHHADCAAMTDDGRFIAVAHQDGRVSLWQPTHSRRPIHAWQVETTGYLDMRFTDEGKTLIAVSLDGVIHRWNIESKQYLPPVKTEAARKYQ